MGTRNLHKPFRLKRERDVGVKVSRQGSSRRLLALERQVMLLMVGAKTQQDQLRTALEAESRIVDFQLQRWDLHRNRDKHAAAPDLSSCVESAPATHVGYRPQPPAEVRRSLLVSTGPRERLWVVAEQAEIDGRRTPWADTPVSRREWLALAIAIVRQAIAARPGPAKPHDQARGRPR